MDPVKTIGEIISLAGGASGLAVLIGLVINYAVKRRELRNQKKATDGDYAGDVSQAASAVSQSAVALVGQYEKRIQALEVDVRDLKKLVARYADRIIYLMAGIDRLIRQIRAHGQVPCWSPDDWQPGADGQEEQHG